MAYVLLTKGRAAFTALDGSGATRPSYSRLTENPITNPRNCAILSLRVEQTPLSPSTVEPWTLSPGFRVLWGSLSGRGTNQGRGRRPPRGTRPKPHRYENRVRTREGPL